MSSTCRPGCAGGAVRVCAPAALLAGERTRVLVCVLAVLLALASLAPLRANAETIAAADDSPAARQEAVEAIPLNQINEEAQARLLDVVSRATIYRRLPTEVVKCDPEMYLTLVRNPDVVVNIWRLMQVTDVTMQRTAPYCFHCDDKAGTNSNVELVYGTPGLHVFYADSVYEGPLLARPVKARVVLLLRTTYAQSELGEPLATSTMDTFIRIDHVTANLIARTLSPLVGRTADHNFVESFRFVGRVHETAVENAPGMQRLAMRLEDVEVPTRQKLAQVSQTVARKAQAAERAVPAQADSNAATDMQHGGYERPPAEPAALPQTPSTLGANPLPSPSAGLQR